MKSQWREVICCTNKICSIRFKNDFFILFVLLLYKHIVCIFKFPQVLQICLLPYPMLSSQGHTVSASWLQPVGEVRVRNNSDLENCREILLRKQTAVQCCRLTDFPPSPSLVLTASSPHTRLHAGKLPT